MLDFDKDDSSEGKYIGSDDDYLERPSRRSPILAKTYKNSLNGLYRHYELSPRLSDISASRHDRPTRSIHDGLSPTRLEQPSVATEAQPGLFSSEANRNSFVLEELLTPPVTGKELCTPNSGVYYFETLTKAPQWDMPAELQVPEEYKISLAATQQPARPTTRESTSVVGKATALSTYDPYSVGDSYASSAKRVNFTSELSGTNKAFASIDVGNYGACRDYLEHHPILLRQQTRIFVNEAHVAFVGGLREYAKSCLQQALILRHCHQLSSSGRYAYFKGLTSGSGEDVEKLLDDLAVGFKTLERFTNREIYDVDKAMPPSTGMTHARPDQNAGSSLHSLPRARPSSTISGRTMGTVSEPTSIISGKGYGHVRDSQQPSNQPNTLATQLPTQQNTAPFSALRIAFSDIPLGDFKQCSTFIKTNPAILEDDEQPYLQEAVSALGVGRSNYAHNCIQQALVLRKCHGANNDKRHNFFTSLVRADSGTLKQFIRDFQRECRSCWQKVGTISKHAVEALAQDAVFFADIETTLREQSCEDNFLRHKKAEPTPSTAVSAAPVVLQTKTATTPAAVSRLQRPLEKPRDVTGITNVPKYLPLPQSTVTHRPRTTRQAHLMLRKKEITVSGSSLDTHMVADGRSPRYDYTTDSPVSLDAVADSSSGGERSFVSGMNDWDCVPTDEQSQVMLLSRKLANSVLQRFAYFAVRLRPVTGGSESSTSRGDSQTSRSSAVETVPNSRSSQKRPISPQKIRYLDDHEQSDDDRDAKKPCRNATNKAVDNPLLACPYHRFDSVKYSPRNIHELAYRKCSSVVLRGIHQLKQHLYRVHRWPEFYCGNCYVIFKSRNVADAHAKQRPACEQADNPFQEKMDQDQMKEIKKQKNLGMASSAKWVVIYRILFPCANVPPESHAYTDYQFIAPVPEFMDYFATEAPTLLSSYHHEYLQPRVQIEFDQQTQLILNEAQSYAVSRLTEEIRARFEAFHSHGAPLQLGEEQLGTSEHTLAAVPNADLSEQQSLFNTDTIDWDELLRNTPPLRSEDAPDDNAPNVWTCHACYFQYSIAIFDSCNNCGHRRCQSCLRYYRLARCDAIPRNECGEN